MAVLESIRRNKGKCCIPLCFLRFHRLTAPFSDSADAAAPLLRPGPRESPPYMSRNLKVAAAERDDVRVRLHCTSLTNRESVLLLKSPTQRKLSCERSQLERSFCRIAGCEICHGGRSPSLHAWAQERQDEQESLGFTILSQARLSSVLLQASRSRDPHVVSSQYFLIYHSHCCIC